MTVFFKNGICTQIDEEAVERVAMQRPVDDSVREHLVNCAECQQRVAEQRWYICAMKQALRKLERR